MIKYSVDYNDKVRNDIKKHKMSGNKIAYEKIKSLMIELAYHPRTGTGHPEHLKHYPDIERWSRRINKEHRLEYNIYEEEAIVLIISAYGL